MAVNLDLLKLTAAPIPGRFDRHDAQARQDRWALELERAAFASGAKKSPSLPDATQPRAVGASGRLAQATSFPSVAGESLPFDAVLVAGVREDRPQTAAVSQPDAERAPPAILTGTERESYRSVRDSPSALVTNHLSSTGTAVRDTPGAAAVDAPAADAIHQRDADAPLDQGSTPTLLTAVHPSSRVDRLTVPDARVNSLSSTLQSDASSPAAARGASRGASDLAGSDFPAIVAATPVMPVAEGAAPTVAAAVVRTELTQPRLANSEKLKVAEEAVAQSDCVPAAVPSQPQGSAALAHELVAVGTPATGATGAAQSPSMPVPSPVQGATLRAVTPAAVANTVSSAAVVLDSRLRLSSASPAPAGAGSLAEPPSALPSAPPAPSAGSRSGPTALWRPAAQAQPFAERLMHVYRALDGVHAWIRDAALSPERARAVADAMAAELSQAGTTLAVLTVNGRKVAASTTSIESDSFDAGETGSESSQETSMPVRAVAQAAHQGGSST